jgi:hypothetical protein
MHWNCEIQASAGLGEDFVTSNLAPRLLASLLERLDSVFPRNIRELSQEPVLVTLLQHTPTH